MNIKQILASNDIAEIIGNIKIRPVGYDQPNVKILKNQYDVTKHEIFNETKRPKKEVKKSETDSVYQDVARIAFPLQELIVDRAASFLFGSEVLMDCKTKDEKEKKVLVMLNKILNTNKVANLNVLLARTLFSEAECAEFWYPVSDDKYWGATSPAIYKLRCKIFSPFLGDTLWPGFDEYGDMDRFGRSYYMNESINNSTTLVEYLDLFTREFTYRYKMGPAGWEVVPFITTEAETGEKTIQAAPNVSGRIPIVYYYQGVSEWHKVQSLIERFESTVSNFADTNDYFGRPILTIDGDVEKMPDKGEAGKIISLSAGAKAAYLTWDQAPEAIKLELSTLEEGIFSSTQTPNISFAKLIGLSSPSGIALKLMFLDAHLKAKRKIEIFGPALQRRFNIIKGFIGAIDTTVKDAANQLEVIPIITPYLPSNETELITMLVGATAGKAVMSQKTAVKLANQVDDAEVEFAQIQEEDKAAQVGNIFNPVA